MIETMSDDEDVVDEDEDEEDEGSEEEEEDEEEEEEEESEDDELKLLKKKELVQKDITLIHHIFEYIDETSRRIEDHSDMELDLKRLELELAEARSLIASMKNNKPSASTKERLLAPSSNRIVIDPTDLSFEEYDRMDEAQRNLLLDQAIAALAEGIQSGHV